MSYRYEEYIVPNVTSSFNIQDKNLNLRYITSKHFRVLNTWILEEQEGDVKKRERERER